jgi:hypothetical protein
VGGGGEENEKFEVERDLLLKLQSFAMSSSPIEPFTFEESILVV